MGSLNKKSDSDVTGYLVIRDGKKWSDVFRLVPGRTVTIGRSPTNQIVIREEQASRVHAEIFQAEGKWTLRDLNSRNGTAIGEERVTGDRTLKPGDVIWIAGTQLAFVHDLSTAYDRKVLSRVELEGGETVLGLEAIDDEQLTRTAVEIEPTTITARRQKTRFLQGETADQDEEAEPIPKVGLAAAKLCRLAFELANETTARGIARMALDSLIEDTHVDAGAVLMIPPSRPNTFDPYSLEIIAWRSENRPDYQRVSQFLCETVIREGEAVLARDIQDDSALGLRDSKGEIHATSVICAPIRVNGRTRGLIHLYSTKPQGLLDTDDLEFTLAVAETMALALRTRFREQKLVEDLTKTRFEIDELRAQLGVGSEIIGSSTAMLEVHRQIAKAGPSKATVLIRGESGVGKELVARAIHFSSDRNKGPFVCLNCAALSETLLESELFGHERGAFTGATDRKIGKFEAADKGTLMLDEIGEMSSAIQAKFLRVLEGHPFERVGGSKALRVDVRVIAATNRDLEKAVRAGNFRKDLYFRLHVVRIDVPPLRHRPEDTLELAEFFLKKFSSETGRRINGFSKEAKEQLVRYRWPGNVRELKNVIERAVVLAHGTEIELDEILLTNLATASESQMEFHPARYVPESLLEVERRHITATLAATNWNKSRTSQILGIERSTLDRKIKRHRISRSE
jgi:Nif-specific regulatory protein